MPDTKYKCDMVKPYPQALPVLVVKGLKNPKLFLFAVGLCMKMLDISANSTMQLKPYVQVYDSHARQSEQAGSTKCLTDRHYQSQPEKHGNKTN